RFMQALLLRRSASAVNSLRGSRPARWAMAAWALVVASACGASHAAATRDAGPLGAAGSDAGQTSDAAPRPQAIYVVPDTLDALAESTFFDHPWPSDLRRDSSGVIRLAGYPNPRAA